MTDRVRNLAAMAAHGVEIGQVRQWGPRQVTILAPGKHWARNDRGLVLCSVRYLDGEVREEHFWPRTLAGMPVVAAPVMEHSAEAAAHGTLRR